MGADTQTAVIGHNSNLFPQKQILPFTMLLSRWLSDVVSLNSSECR